MVLGKEIDLPTIRRRTPNSIKKYSKLWSRIFTLKIGDRVRILHMQGNSDIKGKIGKITDYVDNEWKEFLIGTTLISEKEAREIMYAVVLEGTDGKTRYACKGENLERLNDES